MINAVNEFVNYSLLLEKRGVWNYFDYSDIVESEQSNDELRNGFTKIYDYIRTEIIRRLNKVDLVGKIDKFYIPSKLLKVSSKISLDPILVTYEPKKRIANSVKMVVVKNEKSDVLEMTISVDIYNTSFKVLLMHELRHCLQLTMAYFVFHDYYKLILIQRPELINNPDIKKIIDVVYRLNPQESTAYTEQIYNSAYLMKFENKSISTEEVYQKCLNEYKIDDFRWDDVTNIIMSDDPEVKDYILTMFVMNVSEISSETHGYRLFSDKLYSNKIVTDFREKLKKIHKEEEERKRKGLLPERYNVADDIESIAEELSKDSIFYRQIRSVFLKRLTYYRNRYMDDMKSVVNFAIDNAEFVDSNEYTINNAQHHQLYTRIEDKITYIEVQFDDLRTHKKRIIEICDRWMWNIFRKYNMLKRYMRGKCKISFVYPGIFDKVAAINDDLRDVIPDSIQYKTIEDLGPVVSYVNDLKLK